MIRIDIDFSELEADVDALYPTWRAGATQAKQRMWRSRPRNFDESGPSWSAVKAIYIERQANKCAYCERKLEARDHGLIEHDIEHYRPKREVEPWPHPEFHTGDGNPRGYCMLAYDLRNYCAACKTCNSARKRSYFPIEGQCGRADSRDIARLNKREQPMLPYPLGRIDVDPEQIVSFQGYIPTPRYKSGRRHRRARVTIALFALADRSELVQGRCRTIQRVWFTLRAAYGDDDDTERAQARRNLAVLRSGSEPHTGCARAFLRLFTKNPTVAQAVYVEACELLARAR